MELDILIDRIQAKLLINDQMLEDIDAKRTELRRVSLEEQSKILAVCEQVKERVAIAGEALKNKTKAVFNELDQVLGIRREEVRTGSLVLCPELEKITELVEKGEEDKFNVRESWERVNEVLNQQKKDFHPKVPQFYSSPTLYKVKSCDLGYLCMDEFLPNQFELLLTSSVSCLQLDSINHTSKVVCMVKTDQKFTDKIQSHIKFSIKNKNCKETVPYCKEDCKLSEDQKSFQMSFLAQKPGLYMVTVLLYDQHITNSPLALPVISKQLPVDQNKNSSGEGLSKASNLIQQALKKPKLNSPCFDNNQNTLARRPLASPCAPQASIPPQIVAIPPSDSSSPSFISPPKLSPSGPLDLLLHSAAGKLVGLKRFSLEAGGTKQDSVCKPIGMCLLQNKNIVVSSTFDDKVKMFSPAGKFLSLVSTLQAPFTRPTDMVTLHSGQFVVRDDNKVMVFSSDGEYLRIIWQDKGPVKCYGLAQDKEDRLVTIMETKRPRRTDLLFFDLQTGKLTKKIEMEDIISDKTRSKCRFLTYQLDKLYITDLGLDCVYILDPATTNVKVNTIQFTQ